MNVRDPRSALVNALTVDVEDYFQVSAFDRHIDRSQWDAIECRVERNVERLLGLFERPTPMPGSILESVTGPHRSGSGMPAPAAAAPQSRG